MSRRCFNSFIVFVWEDYQCYFVVIDSQCDAFSQVSIIGDAFKVYRTAGKFGGVTVWRIWRIVRDSPN